MSAASPFRVVIFDLDDTLLDTWGQLVQPAAREACEAMVKAGLATDVKSALQQRETLFRANPRADVYAALVAHFGIAAGQAEGQVEATHRQQVRDAGHDAYFKRDVRGPLALFKGAEALLRALKPHHQVHLVTSGSPPTQRQKVELLAIAAHFDDLHYVNSPAGETKDAALAAIRARYAELAASAFLCVGDRVDREIRAAKRLGMVTCRVRYGEFAHLDAASEEETPHHEIRHITEIRRLFAEPF